MYGNPFLRYSLSASSKRILLISGYIGAHSLAPVKQTLNGLIILALLNLAFGFVIPAVDNWAHIGGFISGLASGYFLIYSVNIDASNEAHKIVSNRRATQSGSVFIVGILILISLLVIGHLSYEPENIFPVF